MEEIEWKNQKWNNGLEDSAITRTFLMTDNFYRVAAVIKNIQTIVLIITRISVYYKFLAQQLLNVVKLIIFI